MTTIMLQYAGHSLKAYSVGVKDNMMEDKKNELLSLETVESIVKKSFFGKEVRDYQFILFVDTLTVLAHLKNKIQNEASEKLPKLISELIPLKHLLRTIIDDEAYIIRNDTTINRYITITYLGYDNGPEDATIKTPKKELRIDVSIALDKDKERIFPKKEIRCFDVADLGKEMAEDILERIVEKSKKRDEDIILLIPIAHRVKLADPNGEIAIAVDILKEQLRVLKINHKIMLIVNNELDSPVQVIYLQHTTGTKHQS